VGLPFEVGEYGAHQAVGQILVFGQAEGVELDADFFGQIVADRIAVGKAGNVGDAAGTAYDW
jgi:hypothetical protein